MALVIWLPVTVASVVATCVIRFGNARCAQSLSCPRSCAPAPASAAPGSSPAAAGAQVQGGASSQVSVTGGPEQIGGPLSQAADRRTEAGRLPWAGGQAAAVGTRRAGRRCLPRGASSLMRQGVTDTSRSLRILAEYPSETAQVTGHRAADLAERGEAVPGSAFARCPLGFAPRTRFQRYRKRLVWPSPSVSSMCSAVHPIMRESPCLAPGSAT